MSADIPFFDLRRDAADRREDLLAAVAEVLDTGQFIGGPIVERFEEGFARFLGARHCVAVGNGLDALRISLESAGIGPGDEVLVPGFSYYATWLAVMQTGATPVPVDVVEATASIDPELLAQRIGPRTRAVLPVHLYGIPCDMPAITALARDKGLFVLEDVAQAHGALVQGRRTGTWGSAGAFSFYPTKNLGALGDAGAIVTDDERLAAKAKSRRSYGQGANKYDHVDSGWNSRLDPIQAAFLLRGLELLPEWTQARRRVAATYREALADIVQAVVGPGAVEGSVWHHFVVRALDREALRAHLAERGVGTDVHYPYTLASVGPSREAAGDTLVELPASEALAGSVVSLPIGPWLRDDEIERVADVLAAVPRRLFVAPS